ncbi:MAG: hypothetical protein H6710_14865 [Myxococcales bacterium]|nr:hypothetical protein [Myxococcales bacterium]
MAASAQEVLSQIPSLVQQQDAAALVGLTEHDDKAVRKAVRKAIHVLRTRGVEIPAEGKSWRPGEGEPLRGELVAGAMLDVGSTPGLTRIYITIPGEETNGLLFAATLTAFDQIVGFKAYVQTDGQRARVLRDWARQANRQVPVEYAKARIRWARENTLKLGVPVPDEVNQALIHLGDAPGARPAGLVAAAFDGAPASADRVLGSVGANVWPPLMEVEPFLKRITEEHPEITQETPEEERQAVLLAGIAGDEAVRKALRGPIANLLEDSSVGLWLAGSDEAAGMAAGMAAALRESEAPEALPWIHRVIGLQIASTVMYQQQQQAQQGRAS